MHSHLNVRSHGLQRSFPGHCLQRGTSAVALGLTLSLQQRLEIARGWLMQLKPGGALPASQDPPAQFGLRTVPSHRTPRQPRPESDKGKVEHTAAPPGLCSRVPAPAPAWHLVCWARQFWKHSAS